jgi:hypothetical protein
MVVGDGGGLDCCGGGDCCGGVAMGLGADEGG